MCFNALCERFLGTVRRECLDHLLIFSGVHARRVIREYVTFFNHRRPHQGINQQIPEPLLLPHFRKGRRGRSSGCPFSMAFIMITGGLPDWGFAPSDGLTDPHR
jgi:hypothetical protein